MRLDELHNSTWEEKTVENCKWGITKKNVGGAANQEEETKERQKKKKQIEYRCRRNGPYVNMFDANSMKVTICYLFIDM